MKCIKCPQQIQHKSLCILPQPSKSHSDEVLGISKKRQRKSLNSYEVIFPTESVVVNKTWYTAMEIIGGLGTLTKCDGYH